jgi:hypothetical protein
MDGHDNQIALVLVRERLEKSIVNDAEDGGGGADAKGERKDGNESEAAIFPQAAERELKVLNQNIQVMLPAGIAALFFEALKAAKFQVRQPARLRGSHSVGEIGADLLFQMKA